MIYKMFANDKIILAAKSARAIAAKAHKMRASEDVSRITVAVIYNSGLEYNMSLRDFLETTGYLEIGGGDPGPQRDRLRARFGRLLCGFY